MMSASVIEPATITERKPEMLDRVPVPTDNIYKFYALFSLVLLTFALWASFTIHNSTNEVVFQYLPEVEALKKIEAPTHEQSVQLALKQRKIEIAKSDSKTLTYVLSGFIALSFWGLYYGFKTWHLEIQPLADAQNKAQLEILQLQIEKLKLENQKLAESMKVEEASQASQRPSLLEQIVTVLLARR